jgi:hypothetical protein
MKTLVSVEHDSGAIKDATLSAKHRSLSGVYWRPKARGPDFGPYFSHAVAEPLRPAQ